MFVVGFWGLTTVIIKGIISLLLMLELIVFESYNTSAPFSKEYGLYFPKSIGVFPSVNFLAVESWKAAWYDPEIMVIWILLALYPCLPIILYSIEDDSYDAWAKSLTGIDFVLSGSSLVKYVL